MRRSLLFLLNFSVSAWLAVGVFLSITAIALFSHFPTQTAADVLGSIFPFYGWMLAVFSAAFAISVVLGESRQLLCDTKIAKSLKYLASFGMLINLVQSTYVLPQSKALRMVIKEGRLSGDYDSILSASTEFDFLHSLSTKLNGASILIALLVCIFFYLSVRVPEKSSDSR